MSKINEPTEEWLEEVNEEFNQEDVPPQRRAMEAIRRWTIEFQDPIVIPSPRAAKVFDWFAARTKPESQQIGARFTGAFYFESAFYPVYFPVFVGTQRLDAGVFLETMPPVIKNRLSNKDAESGNYAALCADGLDYIQGYEGLVNSLTQDSFPQELLKSAHGQLKAAVSALLEQRPNPKAMESARMATEMFLKMFLAEKDGLTSEEARKPFGHRLDKAVDRCLTVQNHSDFDFIKSMVNLFPPVEERYKGASKSGKQLWEAYRLAQFTGATVARLLTGNDLRAQLKS